ncbi:MAG TPA: outer membrane lipoprotein carrier protein LolA [Malonomonas sp.]
MRIKLFFVLFLCLLPTMSVAANTSLSDVIRTLETPFQPSGSGGGGTIEDFQAEFFQESQIASLDRVQRGEGNVTFRFVSHGRDRVPQAMFRWEYRRPDIQEIVSDGRTLWVYLPENRQVIESDITEVSLRQSDNPITFLSGLGNLSRDFNIRWGAPNSDRDGNYILDLQPRRGSQLIQTLQIVVDRDAVSDYHNKQTGRLFPILATRVTDPNGNQTSIEFREIRVNRNISERFFAFRTPAGVEVVRPSGDQLGY